MSGPWESYKSESESEPWEQYKPEAKRTVGEAVKDAGVGLMQGGAGLVKSAGDIYGLATGNMDNPVSQLGGDAQSYWEDAKSDPLKAKIAERKQNIDAQDSTLGKAWTAVKDTVTDPALAIDTVTGNAATLLPGAALGRVASGAKFANGLNAASKVGPVGLASREAIAKQAAKFGTGVAVGTGAVQQGADVSSNVYDEALKKPDAVWDANPGFAARLAENGGDREAAKKEMALSAARATFPAAAGVSVAANAIPGGTMLERALVGGAARDTVKAGTRFALPKSIAKGALGEAGQEAIEEGGGQFAGNVAQQQIIDPNQDLSEGVGENAGLGAAGGLLMGGVGGTFHRQGGADGANLTQGGNENPVQDDTDPAKPFAQLGNTPDPLISFPDGTVGRRSDVDAYVNNLPEAQRPAARAKLMGLAPQPAQPIKPSEQMGLDPAAGPLSAAAVTAVDSGVTQDGLDEQANANELAQQQADQDAYDQFMADQDNSDKPITSGKLAEAQMSEGDKRAVLFSNASVADGGVKYEGTQDGDILNGMGAPFATKLAAARRARMEGADWTIAPVFDGFVTRRKDAFKEPNGTTSRVSPTATGGVSDAGADGGSKDAATLDRTRQSPAAEQMGDQQPDSSSAGSSAFAYDSSQPAQSKNQVSPGTKGQPVEPKEKYGEEENSSTNHRSPTGDVNVPQANQAQQTETQRQEAPAATEPVALKRATPEQRKANLAILKAKMLAGRKPAAIKDAQNVQDPAPGADTQTAAAQDQAPAVAGSTESGATGLPGAGSPAVQADGVKPQQTPTVDEAAHAAATSPLNAAPEPTDGQKKAGNYAKGHIMLGGLDLSIENPAGSVRSGKDRDGKEWSNTIQHHYGYIKGTMGNDKDHVDLFVKPETPTDYSGPVFVIDQIHPDTGQFDEHKVMVGFSNQVEAKAAYYKNYAKGWKGLQAVTPMPFSEFKTWVKAGSKNTPLAAERKAAAPITQPAQPVTGQGAGVSQPTQVAATPAQNAEIVEHVTGKGKTLRGVVRKDMTLNEAKAYDKFAFKKDGGVFIREEHLSKLPVAPMESAPAATNTVAVDDQAAEWARTGTVEREAIAKRAGLSPVQVRAATNKSWGDIRGLHKKLRDAMAAPEVVALTSDTAVDAPVSGLFNGGNPDPANSAPMRELDGYKVGDAVDIPARTFGQGKIETLFTRALVGLGRVGMARVVREDGKKLDVFTSELQPARNMQTANAEEEAELSRPGVVNVPAAVDAALTAQMTKQKGRITRLKNEASASGMTLEQRAQAQTKVLAAETTLRKMRTTRFDAEDAAIKAVEARAIGAFADHADLFPDAAKAIEALIGSQAKPQGLGEQLAALNNELERKGMVQNAATRSQRDSIRKQIAEQDFPEIFKAVDGNIDVAEEINRALQYAGDEPKAKTIERVLKNRGVTPEYQKRWTERLAGPTDVQQTMKDAASVDGLTNEQVDQVAAMFDKPKAEPAKAEPLDEKAKAAKAKMFNALGKLATLASKNTRMNWTQEEEQQLLPVVIELFDGAMDLGAVTFQKAVAYVRDFIAQGIDQETADAIPFDTLQGAYIAVAGRHKDKNPTPKKEVAGYESLAELEKPTGAEYLPAGWSESRLGGLATNKDPKFGGIVDTVINSSKWFAIFNDESLKKADGFDTREQALKYIEEVTGRSATLAESLASEISKGNMPKDNPALKKLVETFDGKPATAMRMKDAQEALEVAIVNVSREIVAKNEGPRSTFDALLRIYNSQPNLNIRTSTSIANQAYSTPAPLAFIGSALAQVTQKTSLYEPTAGNGMLTIGAKPSNVTVNEMNPERIESLKTQGFKVVHEGDAIMIDDSEVAPKSQDRVMTNPPFGSVKDAQGNATKVLVDGYKIGQIDHLIAARALETMKDDGEATLIIGANKIAGGQNTDDRIFFNWLYGRYNVTSHFEVSGDLYARQGAQWPVRVITIKGRQESTRVSPLEGTIKRADNWEQVYEQFTASLDSAGAARTIASTSAGSVGTPKAGRADVFGPTGSPATDRGGQGQGGSTPSNGAVRAPAGAIPDSVSGANEQLGGDSGAVRLNADPIESDRLDPAGDAVIKAPKQPAGSAGADTSLNTGENQFQITYTPRSSRKDGGVLIPVNMAQPTQDALSKLEDAVGNIDQYAAKELGYDSVEQMHQGLMGLQVDSVASAIYQISQGKGVIIADQTGIGKGRQAAAVIRWAERSGYTPVFVSVKPSLFTDMYGDLHDIGSDNIKPFILNKDDSIKGPAGEKLFANKALTHKRTMEQIRDSGQLPAGSNVLFMTYSQINTENVQRGALIALANNAVFILDESHNAGGASNTGEFMTSLLESAKGVTYLSATYAKRPDNMPLYFKTDIGQAAADNEGLMSAMAAGGLPLQTVVSNNLVQAGQMFRRERSYDGVSIESVADSENRIEHEKLSDTTTLALRAIVAADSMFHGVFVKQMQADAKAEGAAIQDNAGNQATAGVDHTQFSSVVHNFVKQMLLGLKAQSAADKAVASLKRGEKPLIAVENTMGSFLKDYAADNMIAIGGDLGSFDYRTVLSRALARTLVVNVVSPTGQKSKREIKLSELDAETRAAYDNAQAVIDSLKLNIPVSPLDWMRNEITKAGFTVAEITGRNLAVDYSNKAKPVLTKIDQTEQDDKVRTTQLFNSGSLDAIILNVAGSTGISLHASEKFKDQRQRHMIVAQAAGDINIFMQMLGRVHRTGQVKLPKYTILSVDLPTEKRPTAVLSGKMKSLNANTSSNTDSATSIKTMDMFNKYGDQVVAQYLQDNYELAHDLGVEDLIGGDDAADDLARKATGRLALQPITRQNAVYEEIEAQYAALIEYLNKTNQNDLEPRTFDFDARETRQDVIFEGPDKSTPFGDDAIYGEYSIKAQGKAMSPAEIRAEMESNLDGKSSAAHITSLATTLDGQHQTYVQKLASEAKASGNESGKQVESAIAARQIGKEFVLSHAIGKTFRVEINGESYNAVVTNIRSTHKTAGNPYSLSKIQVTVALNGALRNVTVPATQFAKIQVSSIGTGYTVEQLFKEQPANQRETAKIVTGNLLAAYGEIQGARGTIISFTKQDGTVSQGILLPKAFDFKSNTRRDYRLATGADALKFLQKSNHPDIGRFGIMSRDSVVRVLPMGQGIEVVVPKSKLKGGKYFLDKGLIEVLGDFTSSGSSMRARTYEVGAAVQALDLLLKKNALYALPSMAEEAKELTGGSTPAASRVKFSRGAQGQASQAVESKVAELTASWAQKPNIVVAFDMDDERIPARVRMEDQKQRSGGATGTPEGFYYKGTVYLMSSKLATDADVSRVLFHEALGHYGLRSVYGKSLKQVLQKIATFRQKEVAAKMKQYGLKGINSLDRMTAAEEVLAEMAQDTPTIGFVREAIAAIRTWLRENVPGLKSIRLTDDEIVRSYILPARNFVERGSDTGFGSNFMPAMRAAMSRGTNKAVTNPNDVVGNQGGRSADDSTPGVYATEPVGMYGKLLSEGGKPFPSKNSAKLFGHDVVRVDGGFAQRKITDTEQRKRWDAESVKRAPDLARYAVEEQATKKRRADWILRVDSGFAFSSVFTDQEKSDIKHYVLSDDFAGAFDEGRNAAVSAIERALKANGIQLEKISVSDNGKGKSIYARIGDEVVRISDHELPSTPEREHNRSMGLNGKWGREVIVSDWQNTSIGDYLAEIKGESAPSDARLGYAIATEQAQRGKPSDGSDGNTTTNESTAPDSGGAPMFSRSAVLQQVGDKLNETLSQRKTKIAGETTRQHTPEQLAAMRNVGFQVEVPSLKDRAQALWKDAGKKLAQGLVDQFAPVRDISKEGYRLLRLSKGASGAFEVFLKGGMLKLNDNVYDFDASKKGGVIDKLLKPLGGEHHDFFRWIAANRAERLAGEGKENLFTPEDIKALKTLAEGKTNFDYTIQNGIRKGQTTRDRAAIYADSLVTFNAFQNNVMDMAEQSGLIDGEARKLWEREFYVPFYRVEEDGSVAGADIKSGVVRQQAFKSLTGRANKLNADLLDNTLMNWAHLLDASAKNRAAMATISAAEKIGAATPVEAHAGEGTVWFRENGEKRFSVVEDPHLLTAISALEYAGMRNPAMKAMGAFKHALTIGVTASPFFKVRNLIRDSLQVVAVSPIGANPLANVKQGWALTKHDSDAYFRLMAGGGTIHFGSMLEGSEAKRVQSLVESGVDDATILNSDHKVKAFYQKFIQPSITAYNELGDRGEAINRAALYDQLTKQGVGHAEASLMARDLMDFSMQGSFTSIRFLTQVVPFLNARIQGLYKLGRAAKEDPARFSATIGATALFSLALLAAYSDDDDWKKREDWDRNNFWWFKMGGQAFRIPKPFEIGAIATLAERGAEYMLTDEMTGKRLREQILTLVGDNLSMNPIPQMVKPMLDVYANKDSFSGRPIESMGMEKLQPEYRFNGNTSMTARAASTTANAITGLVGASGPSPVQIDHMLRGYFGWLGSFVVGAGDVLARFATDQPDRPAPDYWKTATGSIASNLQDAPSRYVSQMYTQARTLEQAYGTWRSLVKEGKTAEAATFREENRAALNHYRGTEAIKNSASKLNNLIRIIERSNLDSDVKRDKIRPLQQQKDALARRLVVTP